MSPNKINRLYLNDHEQTWTLIKMTTATVDDDDDDDDDDEYDHDD